ncbi:lactococcin 972 family bacteriocin [Micromonospora azadirachtae]|uniref:Lactococcin 972 family bacteriocin n=1 Tax=Micromonospora azadirachtae TaxID=1970735 RepID=A0ABW2ZYW1_9ACTN
MRRTRPATLKRKATLAAVTGLMAVGVATPAYAAHEYVGGGEWWYAVSVCCNWSDYNHPSQWHRTSVSNSGGTVKSDCMPYARMASATQTASISGNKAYWSVYC